MTSFKSASLVAGALDYRALISELTTKLSCALTTDTDSSNRNSSTTGAYIDHNCDITLEDDDVCYGFFCINFSQSNGGSGVAQIDLSATLDGSSVTNAPIGPQVNAFDYQTVGDTDTGRGTYSKVLMIKVEDVAGIVTFLARISNLSSGDSIYVWFSEWNFLVTKKRHFNDRLHK